MYLSAHWSINYWYLVKCNQIGHNHPATPFPATNSLLIDHVPFSSVKSQKIILKTNKTELMALGEMECWVGEGGYLAT